MKLKYTLKVHKTAIPSSPASYFQLWTIRYHREIHKQDPLASFLHPIIAPPIPARKRHSISEQLVIDQSSINLSSHPPLNF